MQNLSEWLNKRRELEEKAIPGPYKVKPLHNKAILIEGNVDEWERLECQVSIDDCCDKAARRTARFIADARLSLPTALRIIETWDRMLLAGADRVQLRTVAEQIINERSGS